MAEAKAEVMEEIEDGREEGEEEDSTDATSVRPGKGGTGGDGIPAGLGWYRRGSGGAQEGFLFFPSLEIIAPHATGYVSQHMGQGEAAGMCWPDSVSFQERAVI